MNVPDFKLLIGTRVDFEFLDNFRIKSVVNVAPLLGITKRPEGDVYYAKTGRLRCRFARPRFDHPLILESVNSLLGLTDFVWTLSIPTISHSENGTDSFITTQTHTLDTDSLIRNFELSDLSKLEFKGVKKNSIFSEWATFNGVPLISLKTITGLKATLLYLVRIV